MFQVKLLNLLIMEKLTLIAFALTIIALRGYSQNIEYPKHQVSAFYCYDKSLYSSYDKNFGVWENRMEGDDKDWNYTYFSGTYNVQYLSNFINPLMSMGVQVGYEETCSKHWQNLFRTTTESVEHWTEKDRMPYILCVMQLDLLRRNWIGFYTKAGMGMRFVFTEQKYESGNTDNIFKWIPCLVGAAGIEVGPQIVRVFGELGLGAQGLASFGIRGRF